MIFVDTLWTQNQSSTQHFSNEETPNAERHQRQVARLTAVPCPCSSCTVTQDIVYNIYDNRIDPKVQPYVLAPNSSRETNVAQDTTDNDSDVASRPGRTLNKDVDENPTENPSQVPLEETPNAEQTVNIISSDDDDFKLSKKTSRRKRAKKADDDDEFIPSKKTTKPKKAKQEKTTKPRRSKTSFYQKGQIVWYIAVRSKKMSEKGNLVWDGVPRSVVNIFDDNFKLKDNEVLLANLRVATSETIKPLAFRKFVTPIKEVGNPSRKSAQTGHECLITFSEENEENQRIFNILCQKLSEDEVEKIRKQMEIVRKVEIEDIWDEEEKFLYLTGAKEFISDVNKNNPEPESEPSLERIKTRRSSGRLSKNDIIIEPVETSNEPKIVNEEVVKYFETNKRLKEYLLDILKGKHPDLVRHRLSMDVNARFGGHSEIQHLSNVLFLQEEEDGATDRALFRITHNLVLDAKEDVACHDSYQYDWHKYFKENYAKYVLIPQGIIYYLKNKLKMNDEAEEYFMQHKAPKLKSSDPDDDEPVLPPVQESRRPYHWDLYQNNPYDNVDHIPDID